MPAITHVSSNNPIPPDGNPSTSDIAYWSVADLGTFTPDAAGNPTASPDVTYLAQEAATEIVHVSRDRFNLVQKNADIYFGSLPVNDTWALVWSEIRAFNVSGQALPITEIFIIASYDGGLHLDTKSYVRLDDNSKPMAAFYSLPTPVELCGMIEDKSGTLGALDYIDVRIFFGECASGCETANPVTCHPLWATPVGLNLLSPPAFFSHCIDCRGKPLYISYFVPQLAKISALACASPQEISAKSEIQNIQKTYGGLCEWVQEQITAKYWVPFSWGIPFQSSRDALIAAVAHIT